MMRRMDANPSTPQQANKLLCADNDEDVRCELARKIGRLVPGMEDGETNRVRDLAIAVRPVVPTSIDRLLDQMGIANDARDFAALENGNWFLDLVASGFRLTQPEGVFPRLEMPAEEAS